MLFICNERITLFFKDFFRDREKINKKIIYKIVESQYFSYIINWKLEITFRIIQFLLLFYCTILLI